MAVSASCPGCGSIDRFEEIEKVKDFLIVHCLNCGLDFSNPMKNPGGEWYDQAYILRHSAIDTRIRDYYRWALKALPLKGKLLDVGCGEGVFVAYAKKKGFDAYGIDFSKEAIKLGTEWYGLRTLYNCSLSQLKSINNLSDFNIVVFFEVLEHLEKPVDFLREVETTLQEDGFIALSVPSREKWPIPDIGDYPPNHLTRWTEKSLRIFFEMNGFSIVRLEVSSRLRSYHIFLGYLIHSLVYRMLGMHAKGFNAGKTARRTQFLKLSSVRRFFSALRPRQIKDFILWPVAVLTYPFVFPWFKGSNIMIIAKKTKNGKVTCPAPVQSQKGTWIDRSLNYGRHHIKDFLSSAGAFATVLDLGAGQGDDLMLAQNVNPHAAIHAVEVCSEYAARLLEKGIRVHSLNIERDALPFPDRSVDIVMANQVLEHVKELFWIFHEISRVLPVGGKLILGIPNLAALHNRILLAFGRQPSPLKNNSAHIRGYTKRDLLRFLESCFPGGYQLKKFGGSNFYPFPPVVARPLAKLFPNMAWGIFFMFEKQREYKDEFLAFPIKERLETNFYVGK